MHIRRGDNIIVISGSERGKRGAVSRMLTKRNAVIIEGVNLSKRHSRPRKTGQKGQVIEKAMPIHISNVSLMEGGKAVRTARKLVGEKWVRVSRKTGKEL